MNIDENVVSKFRPNILIVDLFRNELLNNQLLESLLDKIQILKFTYDISYVIEMGTIATILQKEIGEYNKAIDYFGRHRLVHFIAKSLLQVIPHTKIERKLEQENLLIKCGFSRKFKFLHSDIADVYTELSSWTSRMLASRGVSFRELSSIKIAEWSFLKKLVNF